MFSNACYKIFIVEIFPVLQKNLVEIVPIVEIIAVFYFIFLDNSVALQFLFLFLINIILFILLQTDAIPVVFPGADPSGLVLFQLAIDRTSLLSDTLGMLSLQLGLNAIAFVGGEVAITYIKDHCMSF